jgi:hypothetical protein
MNDLNILSEIFKDDLQRDETINYINSVLNPIIEAFTKISNDKENIATEHGGALAINATFGMGKTFFCTRYNEYLQKSKKYNSIVLNVFLYDYQSEPLLFFSEALFKMLNEGTCERSELKESLKSTTKFLWQVTKCCIPPQFVGFEDFGDMLFQKIFDEKKKSLEEVIKDYKESLREICKNKPVVIFIDELDRCKPDFALLILERLKHYFFDIPGLLFVLMINQTRLEEIINHTYGIKEPSEYLEKFLCHNIIDLHTKFDNENGINKSLAYKLYDSLLKEIFKEKAKIIQDTPEGLSVTKEYKEDIQVLAFWAEKMKLSLRDIVKLSKKIKEIKIKNNKFNIDSPYGNQELSITPYLLSLIIKYPKIIKEIKEISNLKFDMSRRTKIHEKCCNLLLSFGIDKNSIDSSLGSSVLYLHKQALNKENLTQKEYLPAGISCHDNYFNLHKFFQDELKKLE